MLQQALTPIAEVEPQLQATLENLEAQFTAQQDTFGQLLLEMQLQAQPDWKQPQSDSSSSSDSSEEEEDDDKDRVTIGDSGSGNGRKSRAGSKHGGDADDGSSESSSMFSRSWRTRKSSKQQARPTSASTMFSTGGTSAGGLSDEAMATQKHAMAVALGEVNLLSPAEQRRQQSEAEAKQAAQTERQRLRAEKKMVKVKEQARFKMSIFKHANVAAADAALICQKREEKQLRLEEQAAARRAAREQRRFEGEVVEESSDDEVEQGTAAGDVPGGGALLLADGTALGELGAQFGAQWSGDGGDHEDGRAGLASGGSYAASASSSRFSYGSFGDETFLDSGLIGRHYSDQLMPLRVRYWKELRDGFPMAELGYARWYRAQHRPPQTPDEERVRAFTQRGQRPTPGKVTKRVDTTADLITPAERVLMRRVLPPAASQTQRAIKQTIKIRRKKGKQVGRHYVQGAIKGIEVEPPDGQSFMGDAIP